jgi:hypothetical protein
MKNLSHPSEQKEAVFAMTENGTRGLATYMLSNRKTLTEIDLHPYESLNEERELNEPRTDFKSSETTTTSGNFHGHRFVVPREVYSNPLYREYLNHAETTKNVRVIVDEYYRKGVKPKSARCLKKQARPRVFIT